MERAQPDLLRRARAGDPNALDALFGWLVDPAYRLALALLRDREAAEDAVQEAAVRAWRKLGSLPPEAEVRPWFLAFVANQCRNARRARWLTVVKLEALDRPGPGLEDGIVLGADLRRVVRALSYDLRLAVVLHYYLDLPLEEIAAITKAPLGTVKSRLHRATAQLRARLLAEEVAS